MQEWEGVSVGDTYRAASADWCVISRITVWNDRANDSLGFGFPNPTAHGVDIEGKARNGTTQRVTLRLDRWSKDKPATMREAGWRTEAECDHDENDEIDGWVLV